MSRGSIKPEERTNREGVLNTSGYRLSVLREILIIAVGGAGAIIVPNCIEPMYDFVDDYAQPWPFAAAFTALGTATLSAAFILTCITIYQRMEDRMGSDARMGEAMKNARKRRR